MVYSRPNLTYLAFTVVPIDPRTVELDTRFLGEDRKSTGVVQITERILIGNEKHLQRLFVFAPTNVIKALQPSRYMAQFFLRSAGIASPTWKTYEGVKEPYDVGRNASSDKVGVYRLKVEQLDPDVAVNYQTIGNFRYEREHFSVVATNFTTKPEFRRAYAQALVEAYVAHRDGHPHTVENLTAPYIGTYTHNNVERHQMCVKQDLLQ